MNARLAAAALLLLIFCSDIESYRIQKREEPPSYMTQVQSLLATSWDSVSANTMSLLEKVKEAGADIQLMDMYNKGTNAVKTYTDVLSDQFYHWWLAA